jgi:hypothetical protein
MALFGSARDASLVRSVNRELINRYIDTEVALYKLDLKSTKSNLYGESDNKVYFKKLKMPCLALKETRSAIADEYGLDYTRTGTFAFLRDDLKDKNIITEEGDVIEWDGEFGLSISVVCQAHVTRRSRLNIQELRSGINKEPNLPRNL